MNIWEGGKRKEEKRWTYTTEYDSTIKKNEILSFAMTWMEPEGIKLSEISQRKTSII